MPASKVGAMTREAREGQERRQAAVGALVSCACVPAAVALAACSGRLYELGSRSAAWLPALLLACELGKARGRHAARALALALAAVALLFPAAILFGAPALERHEQTLMLALLLAVLGVLPPALQAGPGAAVRLLAGVRAPDHGAEAPVRHAAAALCGAWLGAIVIPLDWDRPWQVWPVPCYLGALAGYLCANLYTVLQNLSPVRFNK